jgi:hypothetical protein
LGNAVSESKIRLPIDDASGRPILTGQKETDAIVSDAGVNGERPRKIRQSSVTVVRQLQRVGLVEIVGRAQCGKRRIDPTLKGRSAILKRLLRETQRYGYDASVHDVLLDKSRYVARRLMIGTTDVESRTDLADHNFQRCPARRIL